jgi:hypothetical protein
VSKSADKELYDVPPARTRRKQAWETNSLTYVLVSTNVFIDIAGRELVQLLVVSEDDYGNVDGTEDRKLMRLLEQAGLTLEKGAV